MKKLLSIASILATSALTMNVQAGTPKEINLGILGGQNATSQITDNKCVKVFLEKKMGVKVNLRNASNYDAIIQGCLVIKLI